MMSHDDETKGAPAARSARLDDERLPEARPEARPAARPAADPDSELTALRRDLLLYGTAGQMARTRVAAPAI